MHRMNERRISGHIYQIPGMIEGSEIFQMTDLAHLVF